MRKQEEYLALLDETVAFYSEPGRRSVVASLHDDNATMCVYFSPDGRNCALGRCIDPKFKDVIVPSANSCGSYDLFDFAIDNTGDKEGFLLPQYRGFDPDFWADLQSLHDGDNYWSETGLTQDGQVRYNQIKDALIAYYSIVDHNCFWS